MLAANPDYVSRESRSRKNIGAGYKFQEVTKLYLPDRTIILSRINDYAWCYWIADNYGT